MQFFLFRYQAERQSRIWLELHSLQEAGCSAENRNPCVTMYHNKIVMKQYRTCQKGFRNTISNSVFYAYCQHTVSCTSGVAFLLASANSNVRLCGNLTIYSNPQETLQALTILSFYLQVSEITTPLFFSLTKTNQKYVFAKDSTQSPCSSESW